MPPSVNSRPAGERDAAQQAVEDRRPHLVATVTASFSPVGEVPRAGSSLLATASFADAAAAERRYVGQT
jgi:hypothetical protein